MADTIIPFVPEVQQVIDRVLDEARRTDGGTREEAGRARVERDFAETMRKAKVKFADDVRALFAFMTDPRAPAQGKVVAIGALLYFVLPLDLVPDVLPLVGYVDDAAVIASAVGFLNTQLAAYRRANRRRAAKARGAAAT